MSRGLGDVYKRQAKHLADRFSDLQVYAISGWEFCDNTPYRLDDRCAVIGVSDYGKTEEVIKALELGRACGALTAAFTKRADSPITSAAEFSIDYQADCIWEIHLLLCYSVVLELSLIHISEPTRHWLLSRMPSSA